MIWPMQSRRGLCCVVLVALVGCTGQATKEELLDSDGDGSPVGEDCDDDDAAVAPDAAELCDGVDNDCDGVTDEDDAEDAGTWHADEDGDGYGDASDTTACTQPEGTLDNAEDCDDDDPTVYPGAAEVCGDGVVNDCDGEAATAAADCGLGGTVSLASADLKLVGEVSGDIAGFSVSGAGDVDGDGRDDLLVGAGDQETGGAEAGAAYLLLSDRALAMGSSSLDLSEADLKLVGEASGDFAGRSVSGAGDVDGDGRDDLLVGASGEDTGGTKAGAVYLLLSDSALASGSSLLDLSEADLKLVGEAGFHYAGISVSEVGDVDGDGRDDLLVGAYGEDTGGTRAGAAYLLLSEGALASGSTPLELSEADVEFVGEASHDGAGISVSGAGDVDGDGRDDLLVGAYCENTGGEYAGVAYLLLSEGALASGSTLLDLSEADAKLVGEAEGDLAGSSVSGAGDVNGDGRDDLLVGAYGEDTGGTRAGAAYLLLSEGALASAPSLLELSEADVKLVGEASEDSAGYSVSGVGDVDGDGRDDLLVGAYGEDTGVTDAGAAYLLLSDGTLASGSSLLELSEADVKFVGEASRDWAGRSVSGAGDVNGDGFSDLLLGAYQEDSGGTDAGAAYLLYGGVFGDGY